MIRIRTIMTFSVIFFIISTLTVATIGGFHDPLKLCFLRAIPRAEMKFFKPCLPMAQEAWENNPRGLENPKVSVVSFGRSVPHFAESSESMFSVALLIHGQKHDRYRLQIQHTLHGWEHLETTYDIKEDYDDLLLSALHISQQQEFGNLRGWVFEEIKAGRGSL